MDCFIKYFEIYFYVNYLLSREIAATSTTSILRESQHCFSIDFEWRSVAERVAMVAKPYSKPLRVCTSRDYY